MNETHFTCTGCGTRVITYRLWNYRTIPPSMDARDLCERCKARPVYRICTQREYLDYKGTIPDGYVVRVVGVKAWRKPDEDGIRRWMQASGKLITERQFFGEEGYKQLQDEWERRAAEVLNRAFDSTSSAHSK